jgi:hypothetical protein
VVDEIPGESFVIAVRAMHVRVRIWEIAKSVTLPLADDFPPVTLSFVDGNQELADTPIATGEQSLEIAFAR